MALITDPDDLDQGTEVTIDEGTRRVTLNIAGDLSTDGVTEQCLYSFLKEEWKTDATLIPYPFPMVAITPEKMEWVDNWEPYDDSTRKLVRNGGWREYDSSDTLKQEWLGVITLGTIDAGHNAYYNFDSLSTKTDFTYEEAVNEPIKSMGDASHGDFDYRTDDLTVYVREQGKTYDRTTSVDVGIVSGDNLDYKVIRFPLSEATDLNITETDGNISTIEPYISMGIEFFATPQAQDIPSSGDPHNFGITVTGAAGSVKQIYEFLQWSLRQGTDIDDGSGTHLGVLTDDFALFIGSRLDTLAVTNSEGGGSGTFLDNVATNDTNNMRMIDNLDTYYEYPFVSTGRISFNTYLTGDANAIYRMYFLYNEEHTVADLAISSSSGASASLDSTGSNLPTLAQNDYIYIAGATNVENNGLWKITDATPSGTQADADKYDGINPTDETEFSATLGENPYGTPSALIVDDNSDTDISGDVSSATYVDYDFDYDGNTQGGRTAAEDANVVLVGIGHDTAQFVTASLVIERKTGNNVTMVSALERNFSNP